MPRQDPQNGMAQQNVCSLPALQCATHMPASPPPCLLSLLSPHQLPVQHQPHHLRPLNAPLCVKPREGGGASQPTITRAPAPAPTIAAAAAAAGPAARPTGGSKLVAVLRGASPTRGVHLGREEARMSAGGGGRWQGRKQNKVGLNKYYLTSREALSCHP